MAEAGARRPFSAVARPARSRSECAEIDYKDSKLLMRYVSSAARSCRAASPPSPQEAA